ncbi:MAG: ABC transporter ATP-binding protein [Ardenticatenaceae bacterium]|nr:ABC transporter ATP-binding protein [Ardenticatenaceae bacterium]
MIALHEISKIYQMGTQTVHALRGINLQIEQGEYVAIMGASGSGKSTLMNVIGCLDTPTEGRYLLDNIDVSDMDDDEQAKIRNQRIGFVFQQFNLLARTAAIKQVALPLMYGGVDRNTRVQRAQEKLSAVGLGDRIDHRPDELSGGQQQRVAIARALVTEPSIILADEPTGALDSASGQEIMSLFDDLSQQGITIIMVTHDQEVGERAQRIIRLKDGRVIDDKRHREIRS